ncbi:DUF368 domain-containing protein [Georgenia wangjunii]|uniref:DUF368 domain-containing protein n=1 Tax=Georgenia wangjunii TaxID=3117730 RepID=UPI002F26CE0A
MHLQQPVLQVIRGFVMGAADIVPGVSGGTVALVLGIYERLVAAIRAGAGVLGALARRDLAGARNQLRGIPWVWLLSLLAGILLAVALLSAALERVLEEHPQAAAGLFFGLIVGAIVISWRLVRRRTWRTAAVAAVAAALLFVLVGLQSGTGDHGAEAVTRPAWMFFAAGAVAICAMILPGISGSFILVLLGMYAEVLGAVNERDLLVLGLFVLGAAVGLASFSTLLSWLLLHHHDVVLAALIGLMVGSLRILWPWPGGLETTELALPAGGAPVLVPVALAAGGLLLVVLIDAAGTRLGHRRALSPSTQEEL